MLRLMPSYDKENVFKVFPSSFTINGYQVPVSYRLP